MPQPFQKRLWHDAGMFTFEIVTVCPLTEMFGAGVHAVTPPCPIGGLHGVFQVFDV
jgi:hypothetical protein